MFRVKILAAFVLSVALLGLGGACGERDLDNECQLKIAAKPVQIEVERLTPSNLGGVKAAFEAVVKTGDGAPKRNLLVEFFAGHGAGRASDGKAIGNKVGVARTHADGHVELKVSDVSSIDIVNSSSFYRVIVDYVFCSDVLSPTAPISFRASDLPADS